MILIRAQGLKHIFRVCGQYLIELKHFLKHNITNDLLNLNQKITKSNLLYNSFYQYLAKLTKNVLVIILTYFN
ncbi:hypothetical protein BpHYR1_026189 [Brachionus plicatilis]|uniref:Uncharacterized protein n=1 Tax=Brachionus plicatilis TaxID=10195 RepID=A0A3M7T8I9_BRAPC|nr:hypothetical protein BpHYR1_026189 [Brachionus plicatilis]